jgi:glycoside/pentoside/hexuronide:cation symporter, GPH family
MTPRAGPSLGVRRLSAFALLGVATGGFNIPLHVFLPPYYTTTIGLPLQTVGLIFLIARLLGAVTDPLVGWASDRTRTRHGRRKPWILVGGGLFLLATLALFSPPRGAGAPWLLASLLAACLGWTATSTPLYAWGGELSADPRQRARVQAYIQTAASIGIFCVLLLPALLELLHWGSAGRRIQLMGLLIGLVLACALPLIGFLFREAPVSAEAESSSAWTGVRQLVTDPTLLRIIGSDFCVSLGQGIRGAVFVFFVSQYMRLGFASALLLTQYAVGIVASPLWAQVSYRLGRTRTLVTAELIQVAINLLLLAVLPGRLWLLVALIVAQGLTQGSGNLMLRAMIYDVADRHRRLSGSERAGVLSSIFNVTTNAAMAVSVGAAFVFLSRFGFRTTGVNDGHALGALVLVFALGPALGHLASALLIVGLPIQDIPRANPPLQDPRPDEESLNDIGDGSRVRPENVT